MKIVHIGWLTVVGGGELFQLDLMRSLQARGYDQELLCVGPGGPPFEQARALGFRARRFDKRGKLGLDTVRRLAAALRDARADVVQTHGEAGIFWGLPATMLVRRSPVSSLVYQVRADARDKMFAARWLLPRADAIIAGSTAVRRFLTDELGIPAGRVEVIHCAIETARFAAAAARADAARSEGRPVLVTVGRLVEQKGHGVLLEAFARLLETVDDAELRIVGDGPLLPALRRRAAELGIERRVRFLGTLYPTTGVLAEADLFVFPSLFEPQGLALVEALAAGVPVVASNTGGIREMIEDGREGRLVEPANPAALAAAMQDLLGDPPARRRCARLARERARDFDIEVIAARYERLYARLVAER